MFVPLCVEREREWGEGGNGREKEREREKGGGHQRDLLTGDQNQTRGGARRSESERGKNRIGEKTSINLAPPV